MTAPELLKAAEVAALLRVGTETVNNYARTGRLASVQPVEGGHRRYFKAEVDALLRGEPLTPEQVQALRAQLGGTA